MSLIKSAYIYLISNIINSAIPFMLLPILTRYLSPSEYGQIAMFQTLLVGLSAFVGLNTVGAANRKYYDDNSKGDIKEFNGACFYILLSTLFVVVFLMAIGQDFFSNFLAISSDWIYLAVLVSAFSFIINFRLGQWQIRNFAKEYGLFRIGNSLVFVVLSLILIVPCDKGVQGYVDGLICSGGLFALISVWLLCKDGLVSVKRINKSHIYEALNFGFPLIPHVFGAFLLTAADRFVINDKLGLAQAGVYMVAVQFSLALNVVFDAINKAYVPWLFERIKENDPEKNKKIVKWTYRYSFTILGFAIVPFVAGPSAIVLIAGEEFQAAGKVIGLLCLGQAFGGFYFMVTNYVFYAKKTGMLSLVTIFSGVTNLVLMFCFVEFLGVIGVAGAFCISKIIQFLLTWFLAYRFVPMPWFDFFNVKKSNN